MNNSLQTLESLKTYSLIFIPLILGFLINTPIFGYVFPFPFSILFLAFWFWVGVKFAKLNVGKAYSFLIGNSLTIITFILYIWSFFMVSDANRNFLIAAISQSYAIPTASISARIYSLTNPQVFTNEYVIISYLLMLLVFTAGFLYELKKAIDSTD